MRVNVFGLGYVGSVTSACLARAGHEVIGVDIDEEKVAMINGGTSPVVEPGLQALIRDLVATGRLRATISTPEAVRHGTIGMICVGTPGGPTGQLRVDADRKSTRLNSSHTVISYAVFCLKKKNRRPCRRARSRAGG